MYHPLRLCRALTFLFCFVPALIGTLVKIQQQKWLPLINVWLLEYTTDHSLHRRLEILF